MSEVYPPGEHVPFCMGPDGGGACVGYIALYSDWLGRIRRIEALEAALRLISTCHTLASAQSTANQARAALAPEQEK